MKNIALYFVVLVGIFTLFAHAFAFYQLLNMECVTSEKRLVMPFGENVYKNVDVCIKWKNR